ncbi:hypothetical protein QUF90_17060 [Desulfococcaceae bacterium HSG9]|nr:hypothetical protein [Desulfococcaceae bacterium HSG9]
MKFFKKKNVDALVYIYESEHSSILAEVQQHPNIETGGDLFGTFSHGDMPVIWWATRPGPNALRKMAEFRQDVGFTTKWQKYLMDNFALQYIGSWHSHHKLGLKQPSKGDEQAAQNYARRHNRHRTLEIIVTFEKEKITLRPYFYPDAQTKGWVEAEFRTLKGKSPIRQKIQAIGSTPPPYSTYSHDSQIMQSVGKQHIANSQDNDPTSTISKYVQAELENLDIMGVSLEQKEDKLMIEIPLGKSQFLAVIVQGNKGIKVLATNFIDSQRNRNDDITSLLIKDRVIFTYPDRSGYVLKKIVSFVHKESIPCGTILAYTTKNS